MSFFLLFKDSNVVMALIFQYWRLFRLLSHSGNNFFQLRVSLHGFLDGRFGDDPIVSASKNGKWKLGNEFYLDQFLIELSIRDYSILLRRSASRCYKIGDRFA